MESLLCIPHEATPGQIKTPVQCVENPKGSGGVIIYDRETFTMNKQHLVAVHNYRGDQGENYVRPIL
ncbi:hypothetical protein QQF64_017227 [Cirrhinus molitorella]|uniref:Uncharacterized protein n=2 Tax=Cirrhinus molitorella TaxID=172907 RepID=A0ABR3LLB6_9TELE|nr:hypothetical protein Q8A67_022934 [Cirrhinus molitorella]